MPAKPHREIHSAKDSPRLGPLIEAVADLKIGEVVIDHEHANRVLLSNAEFMALRQRFNTLGILRLFVYLAAIVLAIVSGLNQAYGVLVFGLIASFIVVMILNYNRSMILAKQQGIAIRLGLISESDLR